MTLGIASLDPRIRWLGRRTGQIKSSIGPFLDRRKRERSAYVARTSFTHAQGQSYSRSIEFSRRLERLHRSR
jgi:hypothetical protein